MNGPVEREHVVFQGISVLDYLNWDRAQVVVDARNLDTPVSYMAANGSGMTFTAKGAIAIGEALVAAGRAAQDAGGTA